MKFTLWLYRLLAQALPHEFKIISGAEVIQLYGLARAFSASSRDPRLMVGVPLFLAALVMPSFLLPAWKATQIDPLKALREE